MSDQWSYQNQLPQQQSPLAGLNQAIPEILYGNGSTTPRYQSPAEARVVGAVLGGLFGAWLHQRHVRKHQRLQEVKDRRGI